MADGIYWAQTQGAEFEQHAQTKIQAHFDYLDRSGRMDIYRRALRQYYGRSADGGPTTSLGVRIGGEQGELVFLSANHFASLIREAHVIVTGSRPAFRAISSAASHEAYEETLLAQEVLAWDLHHKQLESKLKAVDLLAFQFGEGWLFQIWDAWAGEAYGGDPETGEIVPGGDIVTLPLRPIDVIRDVSAPPAADESPEWLIIRRPFHRWKLAKRFAADPSLVEAITSCLGVDQEPEERTLRGGERPASGGDYVYGYEFFHVAGELLPQGRHALIVNGRVLYDTPYEDAIPAHAQFADRHDDAGFGFSPAWHMLGLQAALDSATSTALTNHDAFAGLNLWTGDGDEIDHDEIGQARTAYRSKQKPEVLSAPDGTAQSIAFVGHLQRQMETTFGINSVQRGDPDSQLKSGAALALVQSMAVQHHSESHKQYSHMLESSMSARLALYHKHAKTERLIQIAGDADTTVRSWRGEQLGKALRVHVELADPMSQTSEGRKGLADFYLERGLITTMEQHAQVMATGRAEPVTKRPRNQMRLIGAENDRIRRAARTVQPGQLEALQAQAAAMGVPPYKLYAQAGLIPEVLPTHKPTLHITEHDAELSSPEALADQAYAELLLGHVQWHIDLREQLLNSRGWLLEAIGEPVYQSDQATLAAAAAPPMPQPPPDGAPVPEEGAQPGPDDAEPVEPGDAANPMSPQQAEMPRMPINPMTGERAGAAPGVQP
jgi:hypothetical protein